MSKKFAIIAVIVGLLIVGGGIFALTGAQKDKSDDAAMMQKEGDSMAKDDDAMMKDDAMAKPGGYTTLADYNKDQTKYANSAKVYFFHASWCPICQGIHKEIEADPSKVPAGATLIKADFDKETELRKKYGVTYQYTFVQIDNDGNQIKKWSASNLNDVVSGIQL